MLPKKTIFLLLSLLNLQLVFAESFRFSTNAIRLPATVSSSDSMPYSTRKWLVAGGHVLLWSGTFVALNQAWYKDYPKTSFHTFNDNQEWLQMDKAGHVWTAYQLSRLSNEAWRWSGMKRNTSAILGTVSSMAFQSIIEIQDGYSEKWGFSWGDMAANAGGALIFLAQELGWKEQRLQVKMSYWPYSYPSDLVARRNELFGASQMERILKDYNSQTYWLSANIHSLIPGLRLPKWLNIATGYSADLMLGGTENKWIDENGNEIDRTDIPRIRRFYIAPDIDLTKIKTRSKLLRTIFFVINSVKVPAPTLQFSKDGVRGYWLYF